MTKAFIMYACTQYNNSSVVMSADESDGESMSSGDDDMTEDRGDLGSNEDMDELSTRRRASAKRRLPGPPIGM